jgi:hypothetical protein
MFVVEEHEVLMGGLAYVKDKDSRCRDKSPADQDGFKWTCTREDGHPGVHRGGYLHSNELRSNWGAEWDDDRESDMTREEVKLLYGK